VPVFGAKPLCLLFHVLDQLRALNTFGKAGEIFHFRGDGELSARFMSFDDQRLQVRSRRIDGGRISGTAGSENNYFSHGEV
jgi:hypothetical protein